MKIIKRRQCSICGKREIRNNWDTHWKNKHRNQKPRELYECQLDDETPCIRTLAWKGIRDNAMKHGFNVSNCRLRDGKLNKLEQTILSKLIALQKQAGSKKQVDPKTGKEELKWNPIKPEVFKEEPQRWHWLMHKQRNGPDEPYPFQPLPGVQRTVLRLLASGKKVPWLFKEYGIRADEELYKSGHKQGEHSHKRFIRL